jgi:hypothetical protein
MPKIEKQNMAQGSGHTVQGVDLFFSRPVVFSILGTLAHFRHSFHLRHSLHPTACQRKFPFNPTDSIDSTNSIDSMNSMDSTNPIDFFLPAPCAVSRLSGFSAHRRI